MAFPPRRGAAVATLALLTAAGSSSCRSDADGRLRDPKRLDVEGAHVVVRGEVEEVVTPHLFRVDTDAHASSPVWVVSPASLDLEADEDVEISGRLRAFTVAEFQRDYGLRWPDEIREQLIGEILLIAYRIMPTE